MGICIEILSPLTSCFVTFEQPRESFLSPINIPYLSIDQPPFSGIYLWRIMLGDIWFNGMGIKVCVRCRKLYWYLLKHHNFLEISNIYTFVAT